MTANSNASLKTQNEPTTSFNSVQNDFNSPQGDDIAGIDDSENITYIPFSRELSVNSSFLEYFDKEHLNQVELEEFVHLKAALGGDK